MKIKIEYLIEDRFLWIFPIYIGEGQLNWTQDCVNVTEVGEAVRQAKNTLQEIRGKKIKVVSLEIE